MTSSPTMEEEAVTHAKQWLASQFDIDYKCHHPHRLDEHAAKSGILEGLPRHTAIHSIWKQRLLWFYCPGHNGVWGNEKADRLASIADITSDVQTGMVEVLRGLGNFLNMDGTEHHSIDCLKERGVEKGSSRYSTLLRLGTICVN